MNKWALPSILWPGRQKWRSFLPAGAEENFFEGPVVSRRHKYSRQLDARRDADLIARYRDPAWVLNGWTPQVR